MAPRSQSSHAGTSGVPSTPDAKSSLQLLQQDSQLWYRICVFVYDLRHFRERKDSCDRLELIIDPSYLGAPYFSPMEVKLLKSTVVQSKKAEAQSQITLQQLIEATLDEKLNRRIKKRVNSQDFRVCAAHDLAPIFEEALQIKPKELQRDKNFIKNLSADGLSFKHTHPSTKP